MEPGQFRQLSIKPGTLVGLFGDYEEPSVWSNEEQVKGVLQTYLVMQQYHPVDRAWDTGMFVSLNEPLYTTSADGEKLVVSDLLLIQRYPEFHWDDGVVVLVFGILPDQSLEPGPLPYESWVPRTVLLSYAAVLTVEDSSRPSSPFSDFLRERLFSKHS